MSYKILGNKHFLIILTVSILIFTRFFGLNWGNGFYFHPDENNMAFSVSGMSLNDLNPHFFAYGQFPLYLTFFSAKLWNIFIGSGLNTQVGFGQAVLILRFWSAVFSCLSIIFFYFLGTKIFKRPVESLIFALLLIFSPGLIQLAHFGTTESILIFVFAFNLYVSLKIQEKPSIKLVFWASVVGGIGLASKISALVLTAPIYLSLVYYLLKTKKTLSSIVYLWTYTSLLISFAFLLSPYNLLEHQSFLSAIKYETAVATGKTQVFYTRQFINTTPYLFQLTKIFPYISGLPVFLLSFGGLIVLLIKKNTKKVQLLIIFLSVLLYFLYQGQLFTKWTRFMSPVFFVFPLLATYLLMNFNKRLAYFLVFISVIPGTVFMTNYFKNDVRVIASSWLVNSIPAGSHVLSESGNVINMPMANSNFQTENFDFYELDSNPAAVDKLARNLYISDFIIIPSRRVFKNQSNHSFPISKNYYDSLFNGELGFEEISLIKPFPDFVLNGENAEETWTVFDRPTIRVYKKNKSLDLDSYYLILTNGIEI